jgi:hypothetical protein
MKMKNPGWITAGLCALTVARAGAQTYVEITPGASAVTASTSDTNIPGNAVDNNLGTRWSGSGDGAWIRLDLGSVRMVGRVGIATYLGNSRRSTFDIQVSTDNAAWATAFSGQTSGTTLAEEPFTFAVRSARYVRYVGHGNTVNTWNSLTEMSVFEPAATPTPTPTPTTTPSYVEVTPGASAATASANDGNLPGNSVDNSLATRWSANGDGQWLQLDLGSTRTVGYVKIGAYNGNVRQSRFDLQVATSAGAWMNVLTGALTSGTSTAEQTFDFPDANARWVRYLGHGNTVNTWNSVAEISVFATACSPCATPTSTPTPTATSTPTPTATPTGRSMEIMTWVPSYNQSVWKAALQANTGGANTPRNTLTRVAGQMWQVQSNGTLAQGVPDADVQWVVDYSRANGIKFLVCTHNYVNNWNWGVAVSAFSGNRTALINNLVSVVNRWGAAGVDIDFEGNLAGDPNRAEFGVFIRELGARLHGMGKELTVDIFPNQWNQPNMNWISDWTGSVDGIQSMGYDALFGGGPGWQAYRWQQDTVMAAGYSPRVLGMGMPGWTGTWGSGGLGSGVQAHVNELVSGNYNRFPTSIAIWDGQFNGAGWLSAGVWDGLKTMRNRTAN